MKTSELIGPALDWAVAKCEGRPELHDYGTILPWTTEFAPSDGRGRKFHPTTNWTQGGPIIDREKIEWKWGGDTCIANIHPHCIWTQGPTPLVAAMRCFVASKLGDVVHIPRELE